MSNALVSSASTTPVGKSAHAVYFYSMSSEKKMTRASVIVLNIVVIIVVTFV